MEAKSQTTTIKHSYAPDIQRTLYLFSKQILRSSIPFRLINTDTIVNHLACSLVSLNGVDVLKLNSNSKRHILVNNLRSQRKQKQKPAIPA